MKKKLKFLLGMSLVLSLVLMGCGAKKQLTGEGSQGPEKIRVGYVPSAGILQVLPIVGRDKGWFDQAFEGSPTGVEFIEFKSGPILMEAFTAGSLDIGHIGDQPIFTARANGLDVKAFALHSEGAKNYGLVAREGSGLDRVEDMPGKKIGVTLGSIGHRIFNLYLDEYGLNEADVEVVNIPPGDIKNTLESGNIDGAIIWEPWIGVIEKEKIGRQIADMEGLKKNVNITIASEDFMEAYPEETLKILEVYEKTMDWVNDNKEEASRIVAKEMDLDSDIIFRAMEKEDYLIDISDEALASMEDTLNFLEKIQVLREPIKLEDCVDLSFLKKLGDS